MEHHNKGGLILFPLRKIVLMCSVIFEKINEINYNLYWIVIAWGTISVFYYDILLCVIVWSRHTSIKMGWKQAHSLAWLSKPL